MKKNISKTERIVVSIMGFFVLYLALGTFLFLILDHDVAKNGKTTEANILDTWEVKAKSGQIVTYARVEFEVDGKKYHPALSIRDKSSPTVEAIYSPLWPYHSAAGTTLPPAPTSGQTAMRCLLGLFFLLCSGIAFSQAFRRNPDTVQ